MKQIIKETIVGTVALSTVVLFMAAAIIAIYKAAGL